MMNSPEILERSVIRSSVRPSAKYSSSGLSLRLSKGRTAIEGRSGSGGAEACSSSVGPEARRGSKYQAVAGSHDRRAGRTRSDRRPSAPPPRHAASEGGAVRAQPIDPDGLRDVLDRLLAQEVGAERQLALDLVVDAAGNVDAAGLGQRLQAGGDVDAIAEEVVALDHHVAEVDADPELEPPVLGQLAISGCQLLLDLDRASRGFDGTRELGQHAVPGGADDPAVAAGDQRVHLLPVRVQGAERAFLVGRHETAVALHVGTEDGRELTLDARRGSRLLHCAPGRCLQQAQCRFAEAA